MAKSVLLATDAALFDGSLAGTGAFGYDALMPVAREDRVTALLRTVFGIPAGHELRWQGDVDESGAGIAAVELRVVMPGGGEVSVEIRDAASEAPCWISEGSLALSYQGADLGAGHDEKRDRLLALMGANFRRTMQRRGTELRERLVACLLRAANPELPDVADGHGAGGEGGEPTRSEASAPVPVLQMALDHLDDDPGDVSADDVAEVDAFLPGFTESRALASAFEIGLVDRLFPVDGLSGDALCAELGITGPGLELLGSLLAGFGVVAADGQVLRLTPAFRRVLRHRGLLLTRLGLVSLAAQDLALDASELFRDPWEFPPRFHRVGLFDYESSEVGRTRLWVAITTQLTRYEGPACVSRLDLADCRRILDVGGNSGEFARQMCEHNDRLEATVFDVPAVCRVGAEYQAGKPAGDRVSFVPGDVREDGLPPGFDLISFKSMLHDWSMEDARRFLDKAHEALGPRGGRLLIYEREMPDFAGAGFRFPQTLAFPYLSNLRTAAEYAGILRELGFRSVESRRVEFELPFLIVTAVRDPD